MNSKKHFSKALIISIIVVSRSALIGLIIACIFIFLGHPGIQNKSKKAALNEIGKHTLIAHRGHFGEGRAENTIPAFESAVENNLAIELDVHLTLDHKLVVYHDETLGKNGIRPGKNLTPDQETVIKMGHLDKPLYELEKQDIDQVTALFPLYGENTFVPELHEVFTAIKNKQQENQETFVLVEIKASGKNSKEYIKELCEFTAKAIREGQKTNPRLKIAIQSFHPIVVQWFKQHRPEIVRGFLSMNFISYKQPGNPKGFTGMMLANNFFNFLIRPDFIAYQGINNTKMPIGQKAIFNYHRYRFAWTIRTVDDLKYAKKLGYTHFIFDTVDVNLLRAEL